MFTKNKECAFLHILYFFCIEFREKRADIGI